MNSESKEGSDNSNPKCEQHGLPAVLLTTKKRDSPNFGRRFYKCSVNGPDKCNFFVWEDEIPLPQPPANVHPPTPQSLRISSSQPQRSVESPSTPTPSQQRKRTLSSSDLSGGRTMKRMHTFEATLGGQSSADHFLVSYGSLGTEGEKLALQKSDSDLALGSPWTSFLPKEMEPSASQDTLMSTDEHTEVLTADSVSDLITRLKDVPGYIRKLERKKTAAERSRDVKARKILDLEKEIERLKAREQELEEIIAYGK